MNEQNFDYYSTSCRSDASTDLHNHVQLYLDLDELARNDHGGDGALVLVEIIDHDVIRDFFLAYGSIATDRLLHSVSQRIRKLLTASSRMYCVGVGRFALLSFRDPSSLESLLIQLRHTLDFPHRLENTDMLIRIAIGWLPMTLVLDAPEDALRKVSTAIAATTESGTSYGRYSPDFDRSVIRRRRLLQDIPAAIGEDQFHLVYQPKVDYFGCVRGVEALIRWTHPIHGPVSPAEFIPAADCTQLIISITQWVAKQVMETARELLSIGRPTKIAFNVSARNLEDPEFLDFMKGETARFGISPKLIEIECTEHSAVSTPKALEALQLLKRHGFQIALDDFGSGYSNIVSLLSLPIDTLKIDKSLTDHVLEDESSLRLLKGVIDLGKQLGFNIVVEGVETQEIARLMMDLGVDEIQGYWIAKPMPLDQLNDFLRVNGSH